MSNYINKNKNKNPSAFDFFGSDDYRESKKKLYNLLETSDLDGVRKIDNLSLFFDPKYLSRILFFNEIYKQILSVPGYIMEFGCQYGSSTAIFQSLRDIYEPYNRTRKIFAFDTFQGLKGVTSQDKNLNEGNFKTPKSYDKLLAEILNLKEKFSALPHYNRMNVIKGDAVKKFDQVVKENPETLIAMVFFDMDIYKPTFEILKKIKNYYTKGTVVVFDEICDELSPGETVAFRKAIGSEKVKLKRWQYNSRLSYFIVE